MTFRTVFLIIFFFILFCLHKLSAQNESLFDAKIFHHEGDPLPYRILYPKSFDPAKSYPLVLFLHGGGERGADNTKQLTHGVSLFAEDSIRDVFPCIVIAPQCPQEDYWASAKIDRSSYPLDIQFDYDRPITKSLRLAIQLVKKRMTESYIDKEKIYLTGLSMGGMGGFEAIYREPDLFAAAALVCGGGDTAAYTEKQTQTAFWIFHGEEDVVVKAEYSRNMVRRLQELNADVRYTEYPGVNHNSWENAYSEVNLLPWLFNR